MERDRVLRIQVGGQLTVACGDVPLPPPPSKTVAVLLLGLCQRGQRWSHRAEIAGNLYPQGDPSRARIALRQAVLRLRRWIGPDRLESNTEHLRLAPGTWRLSVAPATDMALDRVHLVPDLEHPWVDAMRAQWSPAEPPRATDRLEAFAQVVEAFAGGDPDVARAILLGGRAAALQLPPDRLAGLLALVRPRDRRDLWTLEFFLVQAELYHRTASWATSLAAASKAIRLAHHRKSRAGAVSGMAKALFTLCEMGQLGAAQEMGRALASSTGASRDGEAGNALACLDWDLGDYGGALRHMDTMARIESSWDRATRLHFWTNFAVLAAEAREEMLALRCFGEAQALQLPGEQGASRGMVSVARARLAELSGNPEAGRVLLAQEIPIAEAAGWRTDVLYLLEALAEMEFACGAHESAVATWRRYHGMRRATGSRPTPRYYARRARALRV
ncbi:MAG: hypothetical protein M9921_13175 [Fimbriimonadaceae bacterium]|nr:hypothetical protein [Fimbriimonadaceae bacterium]